MSAEQRERVTVDGLGNIGQGKYKMPVDKSAENDIIELDKKLYPDSIAGVKHRESSYGYSWNNIPELLRVDDKISDPDIAKNIMGGAKK